MATTSICLSCKRHFAPAGVGAVTVDSLRYCPGTGLPGCISYTRQIDTGPGQPPANPFGASDETMDKVRKGALFALGAVLLGALAKSTQPPPRRPPRRRQSAARRPPTRAGR